MPSRASGRTLSSMTRRRTIVTAAILAGALGLTACGTNRQEAPAAAAGGSSCDTSKGTLVIGMVAPLSGSLSALGLGMSHSADLAVDQANQKCTVPGYELAFQPEDDQATPQVAGQAATKLASDPNVVGVVGTLNSSTSQTVQPILAGKSIVQISPANTNPTLTLGDERHHVAEAAVPQLLPRRHHRPGAGPVRRPVPGAEGGQEEHRRDRRRQDLRRGPRRPVRPGDRRSSARRSSRARRSARRTPTSPASSPRSVPLNPDAVYYGGEYPVGGPAVQAARGRRSERPADGRRRHRRHASSSQLGGREGDLATNVGAPAESLPSAKQFIDDYKAASYAEPFGAYGALTYDATNVIIDRLAKAVGDGGTSSDSTRARPLIVRRAGHARSTVPSGQVVVRPVRRHHQQGAHRLHRSRATTSRRSRFDRRFQAESPTARHTTSDTAGGGADPARPPAHRGEESSLLSTFLSQIVNGLVFGSLIGLIALGYTMVYGIIQLINFAHGEIFMVGAYGGAGHVHLSCCRRRAAAVVPRAAAHADRRRASSSVVVAVAHGAVRLPAAAQRPPARPADHRAGCLGGAAGGGAGLLPGRHRGAAVPRTSSSRARW